MSGLLAMHASRPPLPWWSPSTGFLLPLPPYLALAFSLRRKRESTLLARSSHRPCAAWQTPCIDAYLCMPLFSLLFSVRVRLLPACSHLVAHLVGFSDPRGLAADFSKHCNCP